MTSIRIIQDFLARRRLAIVGVSRDPRDFSRTIFREFQSRQYEVFPVNPLISLVDDHHCFSELKEINPPVESVLIMTPPSVSEDVVHQCRDIGVKSVWLYSAAGAGASSPYAISFCKEHHIDVIEGHCPMMFLSDTGLIHRVHRFFSKLTGNYPN